MADFKVQRGTATIAISATTATITAGVDYTAPSALSKAWITIRASNHWGCESVTVTASVDASAAWITNPANLLTSITFSRLTGDATTGINVDWEIIEYTGSAGGANEFIVRGQEALVYGTSSNTVSGSALAPANDSKVAVLITGQGGGVSTGSGRDVFSTAAWNSGTDKADLTRDRNGNVAATVSYAAVEFTGSNWSVQRVSHSYTAAGSAETEAITDVGATTRAFLHPQILTASSASNNYEMSQEIWLSATNAVSFKLDSQASITGAVGVAWIVSNSQTGTGAANCLRYTGTYANDGNTDVTITAVSDLAQSSVEEISQTNTQNSGSPGRDQASHKLTTTTNVRVFHTGLAGTTTYRFAVFEWPTAQAASPPVFQDIPHSRQWISVIAQ